MSEQTPEVCVQIPVDMMIRIHKALSDGKENTIECLNEHTNTYGHTTKKNRNILNMYENEINEAEDILRFTAENGGVPF
ncbi:MAG: hypothetical protein ABUJ92_00730 [Desulfobacterales bacterium]